MAKKKERLDALLVQLGHFPSREQAQRAVIAGWVKVGGLSVTKPGTPTDPEAALTVERKGPGYASRGGLKLEKALDTFGISAEGRCAMDAGASTGGFTDLLLRRGARKVYAVDVGYGQLAWELRQDPRVVVMERTNVRHLTPEALSEDPAELPDLCVIDVSFIGLEKVLPAIHALLIPPGDVVALVKPQFQAGKADVGKGGVVRDAKVHERVLEEVDAAAKALGLYLWGLTHSPIKGPEGNIEFLAYWRRTPPPVPPASYAEVVEMAHHAQAFEGAPA
ncbi:TlyA family RNA methyltransferase [bacterium]|nr:TlyA family RNA methyltransferase [bacterium]